MFSKSCLIALLFIFNSIFSQKINPDYDSELAKKYGADDYGMKTYVFVTLKTGSNNSTNKAYKDSCFAGHMKNIKRLVKENKLIVAGPFLKNDVGNRGLFILNTNSIENAETMLKSDPAINEKFLKPELFLWYGSAALPAYLDESDKVWKKGF